MDGFDVKALSDFKCWSESYHGHYEGPDEAARGEMPFALSHRHVGVRFFTTVDKKVASEPSGTV